MSVPALSDAAVCAHLVKSAYSNTLPPRYEVLFTLPDDFGWLLKDTETGTAGVIIRGARDLSDWLCNSHFELQKTPCGGIHEGFWEAANSFWLPLCMELNQLPKGTRLVLAGHSLGAAIATVLAVQLYPLPLEVYTFASPKTGDARFAKVYNMLKIKTERYTNRLDIVPHLPEGFGYRHVCPGIEFNDGHIGAILENHTLDTYIRNIK